MSNLIRNEVAKLAAHMWSNVCGSLQLALQ